MAVGGAARATSELKTGRSATAAGAGPDGRVEDASGVCADAGGGVAAAADASTRGDVSAGGPGALDVANGDEEDAVDGDVDEEGDGDGGVGVSVPIGVGVTEGMRDARVAASRDR